MSGHASAGEWRQIGARTGAMPCFMTSAPLPPPAPPGRTGANRPREERPAGRRKGREYVNTCEAAKRLGLSSRTLDSCLYTGTGPCHYRLGGCVRYGVKDLDAWVAGRHRR